jgi:hypothetical protein
VGEARNVRIDVRLVAGSADRRPAPSDIALMLSRA